MAYQSEIEKLTARWKENPDQYFAPLADACRKSGDIDYALEVVRAGLERRPTYLSAHIVLGRCLLDQKNDAEAAKVDTAKNYALRGATFGSRPPMFVFGVTIPPIEDRTPNKGLDRCGMRVAMDAE